MEAKVEELVGAVLDAKYGDSLALLVVWADDDSNHKESEEDGQLK